MAMVEVETLPAVRDAAALVEQVIVKGDLAKLTPHERSDYYLRVCESLGMNPLTRPLEYITLNGKLTLYARRDAADQLRKKHGVSVEIVSQTVTEGLMTVHVRARDKSGRQDEDMGVVSIGGLRGEAQANAVLKCVTKAKRRVTLSICGLGFLDETEVEDIPAVHVNGNGAASALISVEQKDRLIELLQESDSDVRAFLKYMGVATLDDMPTEKFPAATAALAKKIAGLRKKAAEALEMVAAQ